MKTQLVCTFTRKNQVNEVLSDINNTFSILNGKVFHFKSFDTREDTLLSYNVIMDTYKKFLPNSIMVHQKKETNTIYQPKLKISWQETSPSTSSLAPVGTIQYRVYSSNLKNQYKLGQKVQIKLLARELYPVKQFNPITSGNVYPTFEYQTGYKLPTESYYTIKDTITKETIIPYDVNSKVLVGTDSNIIRLNFTNFAYGRVYTLVVKTIEDYNEEEFDLGDFEIIK